jgi:hypothetical protein
MRQVPYRDLIEDRLPARARRDPAARLACLLEAIEREEASLRVALRAVLRERHGRLSEDERSATARAMAWSHLLASRCQLRGLRELCPPVVLREAGERLYRAYCREMLARIAAGSPLGAATTAELLALLQAMSLATPLDPAATVLYWDRFAETFPADAARLRSEIGPVAADSYDLVRAKELEAKLRRQLACTRSSDCL